MASRTTSVNAMAAATSYSRPAIQARIDRFGLDKPYDGRLIFDLKPLNDGAMTLEKAKMEDTLLASQPKADPD